MNRNFRQLPYHRLRLLSSRSSCHLALYHTNRRPYIGLEVHVQLKAKRKLFSDSLACNDSPANSNVSLFDAAIPGTLPILNKYCVAQAAKACLALNCHINKVSWFDRKHYFYRDLPSGYQITQKFAPIGVDGWVELGSLDGLSRDFKVGIEQVQLEQDSGKSMVDFVDENGRERYSTDLNRNGIALIEIVSKPDMQSAEEATAFIANIQGILQSCNVSDAGMDDGTMRVDVNVSIADHAGNPGPRCELKNMVSLKQIQKAINAEIDRQRQLLLQGQPVESSTRKYDPEQNTTIMSRRKESGMDYRYFPDPELANIWIENDLINLLKSNIPELPRQKKLRYLEMGLAVDQARQLVETSSASDFFEQVLTVAYENDDTRYPKERRKPYKVASFITNGLFREIGELEMPLETCVDRQLIKPLQIASIIDAIEEKLVAEHQGRNLISKWLSEETITKHSDWTCFHELKQSGKDSVVGFVSADELKRNLHVIINENPQAIKDLMSSNGNNDGSKARKKQAKVFTFFAGKMMRSVGGRADETTMKQVLYDVLVSDMKVSLESVYAEWADSQKKKKN